MKLESKHSRRGGSTLLELMVSMSLLLVSAVGVGLAAHAGMRATREQEEEQLLQAQSQVLLDRMVQQNFGTDIDPVPTTVQLDQIFDETQTPGTVTLCQLLQWPRIDLGWRFSLSGFPVPGEWRVSVNQDLDDNGTVAGSLEVNRRIFRIQVFFNERLILQTNRAKEISL